MQQSAPAAGGGAGDCWGAGLDRAGAGGNMSTSATAALPHTQYTHRGKPLQATSPVYFVCKYI